MSKEIEDYMRLAEKKLPNYRLEDKKIIAAKFAREYGIPYVVLGNYQVFSKYLADKSGADVVYDTSVSDGGME